MNVQCEFLISIKLHRQIFICYCDLCLFKFIVFFLFDSMSNNHGTIPLPRWSAEYMIWN
jgi:hypothetical protein